MFAYDSNQRGQLLHALQPDSLRISRGVGGARYLDRLFKVRLEHVEVTEHAGQNAVDRAPKLFEIVLHGRSGETDAADAHSRGHVGGDRGGGSG